MTRSAKETQTGTDASLDDDVIHRVLAPVPPRQQQSREDRVKRDIWAKLRRVGRAIPFMEDVVAAYYCALDEKTPTAARATLFAALAYFIAPIDLVPDFLALVGLGDDVAILSAVIVTLRTHMRDEHRDKARAALADPPDNEGPIIDA